MHDDAGLGQPLHHRQELAADPRLTEEPVAERGSVAWTETYSGDSRCSSMRAELVLFEVGQRDVVAVEERQAKVVVLDVEALPHAARQLMDEAEDALVAAGVDLARARRLELEAEIGPRATQDRVAFRPATLEREAQPLEAGVEVEVDDVAEGLSVDGHDPVAGAELGARGRRPFPDGRNDHARRRGTSAAGHARGCCAGPGPPGHRAD